MFSPRYNTAFSGSVSVIQTKEIATQLMRISVDCCSQTDTVPVMFSVRLPPSQRAANLRIGLNQIFRIRKFTLKFNTFPTPNSIDVTLISIRNPITFDVHLCCRIYKTIPKSCLRTIY